jgi:hypothetical protein
MALARRRSRTGSEVALTALPVGPEPAAKTGDWRKNEEDHFRPRCCLPTVVRCRFRPTGDDNDEDRALDDDEPRHGRHDRKVLDDHRGSDFDRHRDDEEEAQEGHEDERRHEEHHDEDRGGNRLDSRPLHEVTLKTASSFRRPRFSGAFSCPDNARDRDVGNLDICTNVLHRRRCRGAMGIAPAGAR